MGSIIEDILGAFGILTKVLPSVLTAITTVKNDTGKPWEDVAADVINHLTAGQPNSPSLNG